MQALVDPYFFVEPLPAHHSDLGQPIPRRNLHPTATDYDPDAPLSLFDPAAIPADGMDEFY